MSLNNLPRWINPKENCLWCHHPMDVDNISEMPDVDAILVEYFCENEECKRWQKFKKQANFKLEMHGKKKLYQRYNNSETDLEDDWIDFEDLID